MTAKKTKTYSATIQFQFEVEVLPDDPDNEYSLADIEAKELDRQFAPMAELYDLDDYYLRVVPQV